MQLIKIIKEISEITKELNIPVYLNSQINNCNNFINVKILLESNFNQGSIFIVELELNSKNLNYEEKINLKKKIENLILNNPFISLYMGNKFTKSKPENILVTLMELNS